MPNYSRLILKNRLAAKLSGTILTADLDLILNDAISEVVSDIDLKSMKRSSALSPNMFDDIFSYTCPTDLKSIIDIRPQIKRGRMDDWRLTTEEEFDRFKEDNRLDQWGDPINLSRSQWLGDSIVAISNADFVNKIKISRPVDDDSTVISELDSLGTWVLFGDGTNVTKDSDYYAKGSACINWDISAAGGTTAGIQNSSLTSFDITPYLSGSVFVWTYITSTTYLTNFILRIGSSATVYYTITITTNNEGTAFYAGWNLLRFDFINKVATGSPTDTACTYVALYMTKNALKISETDYRFDWLVMKKGEHYDVIYYSLYGWQTNAGVWLESATADTDYVNCDSAELKLIEYKCAELGERHLRSARISEMFQMYELNKKKYQQDNPSEALLLITTYSVTDT
jgi:hypothetical protein